MKKLLICILILSSAIFLSGSYYEESVDEQLEIAAESGISSAVPEEAAKLLEKIGIDDIDADSFRQDGLKRHLVYVFGIPRKLFTGTARTGVCRRCGAVVCWKRVLRRA